MCITPSFTTCACATGRRARESGKSPAAESKTNSPKNCSNGSTDLIVGCTHRARHSTGSQKDGTCKSHHGCPQAETPESGFGMVQESVLSCWTRKVHQQKFISWMPWKGKRNFWRKAKPNKICRSD